MLSKAVVIHRILRLKFLCIGRQQTRVSTRNGKLSFAYTEKISYKLSKKFCSASSWVATGAKFSSYGISFPVTYFRNVLRSEKNSIPSHYRKKEKENSSEKTCLFSSIFLLRIYFTLSRVVTMTSQRNPL